MPECKGDQYTKYKDKCYFVSQEATQWEEASARCIAMQAKLAKVESLEASQHLRQFLKGR